jgi:exonuclease SbcD
VYDRSIPSPDAVSLFSSFLGKLKLARPGLQILIIPGNHDSAARLGFGRELFAELGIRFVTDPEDAAAPVIVNGLMERCAFFLLPFLNPGSLESSNTEETELLRSQAKLAVEAAGRLEASRLGCLDQGIEHAVLAAHLFAAGGLGSDSERIFLGSAERVDAGLFSQFDYVALGHLHSCQQAGANAWYSGSPLAYSFGETKAHGGREAQKVFLSVTLDGRNTTVEKIPVNPLRKLSRLSGSFAWFFRDSIHDGAVQQAADDYLEITLTGAELTENPLALLRQRFPHLLNIRQDEAFKTLAGANRRISAGAGEAIGARRSTTDDFTDFLTELYGTVPDEDAEADKIKLFEELLAEVEEGENQQ